MTRKNNVEKNNIELIFSPPYNDFIKLWGYNYENIKRNYGFN